MPSVEFVSTGNEWEKRFGYSRIARVGDLILVGGTVAIDSDGSTHAPGEAGAQTVRCFEIIERSLRQIGVSRTAILRSRIFVTDIKQAEAVGLAHKAFFGDHMPCLTQVEVSALITPDLVVEIECDAHA